MEKNVKLDEEYVEVSLQTPKHFSEDFTLNLQGCFSQQYGQSEKIHNRNNFSLLALYALARLNVAY